MTPLEALVCAIAALSLTLLGIGGLIVRALNNVARRLDDVQNAGHVARQATGED